MMASTSQGGTIAWRPMCTYTDDVSGLRDPAEGPKGPELRTQATIAHKR